MSDIVLITDITQPGPDLYSKMTEAQLRSHLESDTGIFIAESAKVIERALDAGYKPISFLMDQKHINHDARPLIERCPGIPVYTGESALLEKLAGFELTR